MKQCLKKIVETTMSLLRETVRRVIGVKCGSILSSDEKIDLETGIYNFAIEEGRRRNVRCVWENPEFQTIYDIAARRSISNIDTSSYVANPRLFERIKDG